MTTRPFAFKALHRFLDDAIAGIRFILRNSGIGAANLNPTPTPHAHSNHIMQPNRLIHRQQFMKSILARRANAQPKIDLRERSNALLSWER